MRTPACLALLLALAACGAERAPPTTPAPEPVLNGIVAHRGASVEAPENTLAALRLGYQLGAESCEIDVRVTRDGAVVLMHDDTTRRTGGVDRAVADQTLAELRALDVGAWKAPAYRGERIPTLGEALAIVPAGRMLFVELKTSAADAPAIAQAILAAHAPAGAVALQAYDPDALAAVAARLPGVPAYWTVDPPLDEARRALPYPAAVVDDAVARGFAGLAVDHRGADDGFVAAVARAGLVLDVWTVNDAAAIAAWRTRARWVETDRPELAASER